MKKITKKDQVVCINGDFSMYPMINQHYKSLPTEGNIYTVREIRPSNAEGGILLEEIINPTIWFEHYQGNLEPAFSPKRFVPLEEYLNEDTAVKEEVLELTI